MSANKVDPAAPERVPTIPKDLAFLDTTGAIRLWTRVVRQGDCLIWTGARSRKGYGRLVVQDVFKPAHALAYELTKGPIPDGLEIDHLCRVRLCVNPLHLEAVSREVNIQRAFLANGRGLEAKTHCSNGHEFTVENTQWINARGGTKRYRRCRTCSRASLRRWKEKSSARTDES